MASLAASGAAPRVAVGVAAVEVVDAVGDVRRLLDFGDEGAGADRVHAARGQEEDVARTDGVVGQQVGDRVVLDAGGVFGRRHPLGESRAEMRPLVRRHDVPHFGLALRPVAFPGRLVVRVYLDREVLPCVDELDEQRKLFAEALEVGFSPAARRRGGRSARAASCRPRDLRPRPTRCH